MLLRLQARHIQHMQKALVTVLSEVGVDMSKFPTAKHFAAWLGLCPGTKISGGKVLGSKI